jgi:hypothetical protein
MLFMTVVFAGFVFSAARVADRFCGCAFDSAGVLFHSIHGLSLLVNVQARELACSIRLQLG